MSRLNKWVHNIKIFFIRQHIAMVTHRFATSKSALLAMARDGEKMGLNKHKYTK